MVIGVIKTENGEQQGRALGNNIISFDLTRKKNLKFPVSPIKFSVKKPHEIFNLATEELRAFANYLCAGGEQDNFLFLRLRSRLTEKKNFAAIWLDKHSSLFDVENDDLKMQLYKIAAEEFHYFKAARTLAHIYFILQRYDEALAIAENSLEIHGSKGYQLVAEIYARLALVLNDPYWHIMVLMMAHQGLVYSQSHAKNNVVKQFKSLVTEKEKQLVYHGILTEEEITQIRLKYTHA